jgi:hypothetical protein
MGKKRTLPEMIELVASMKDSAPTGYAAIIRLWTRMSVGEDGGQFEPWNPMSLREQYYATWSDQDFSAAITAVQEKNCVG